MERIFEIRCTTIFHLATLISLYKAAEVVRVAYGHTAPFSFGKGVEQKCLLSLLLFNVAGQLVEDVRAVIEGQTYDTR